MSADQILRALVVKQMNQFSYQELAFHLADSLTYWTFCRFGAFERTLVLSLPYKLRIHLARDPRFLSSMLGGYLKSVFAWQRHRGRLAGIDDGQTQSSSRRQCPPGPAAGSA